MSLPKKKKRVQESKKRVVKSCSIWFGAIQRAPRLSDDQECVRAPTELVVLGHYDNDDFLVSTVR